MAFIQDLPDFQLSEATPSEIIEKYRGKVPDEVLTMWIRQGFGTAAKGFIKVIDPDLFQAKLSHCLPVPGLIPLFATALADLIVWDGRLVYNLQYRYDKATAVGTHLKALPTLLSDETFLAQHLNWEPYPAAVEKHGELTFNECFAYSPLLALGGYERAESLAKSDLVSHINLIKSFTGGVRWE